MFFDVDKEKVADYLNNNKLSNKCTLCSHNEMGLAMEIVFGITDISSEYKGSKTFPVLPLVCNHCGHVTFISALYHGLAKPHEEGDENEVKH